MANRNVGEDSKIYSNLLSVQKLEFHAPHGQRVIVRILEYRQRVSSVWYVAKAQPWLFERFGAGPPLYALNSIYSKNHNVALVRTPIYRLLCACISWSLRLV